VSPAAEPMVGAPPPEAEAASGPAPGPAPPDRRGLPSPLLVHLAAASASYGTAIAMASAADDPRFPWAPDARPEGRASGQDMRATGEEAPFAVAAEAARRLREMIAGIERYQAHPWARALPEPPAVWSSGSARLLDYGAGAPPGATAVMVTPSLVNRAYILDLHPDRSLLRWLAGQGFRPLLLDWGLPEREEQGFDLSAYFAARMLPAAEAAAELTGQAPAALGYCMGGAFAAALAARRPDLVSRLALIGAPWDFGRLSGLGGAIAALAAKEDPATISARLMGLGEALGAVPVDALQLLFAALDPTLALRKFRRFAALAEDDPAVEIFAATEDWLNDGVTMAAPAARDVAVGWYMRNLTARGEWILDGEPVVPEAVEAPTLAFCSASDRIAPPDCAEALPRAIPGARLRRPRTGHVGMIVGSSAEREVWRPLARFIGGE
ncbi:MAG: alpha/beta fold hydrolase, partial [Pseudomonadota bacterium]|nr:alpha/beta fold hydrolase [Pseudomonadota bacterium]